jgi:hypothetical protein
MLAAFCVIGCVAVLPHASRRARAEEPATANPSAATAQAVPKGERISICGHSFHVYIAEPLALLAKEAGFADHKTVCVQFLGNSRPFQHWNVPDERNQVKRALRGSEVDVLTLSPHVEVPDDGIDRFADLAQRHNPRVRVFLQLSWSPYDGKSPLLFHSEDRDRVTANELNTGFRRAREAYLKRLREQAQTLNERHHREFVHIVPVAPAVDRLRAEVLAGHVPGINKQSELFRDSQGHGNLPVKQLATYCWFAAIYRRTPVGLTALEQPGDAGSQTRQRLLQEIAWEAVTQEPSSGVPAP